METVDKAHAIVDFLENKKAEKIVLLDIHELTPLADYFIICTGTSERMLQALASSLREYVKEEFGKAVQIEGESRDGWLVADVEDVIVHIFSPDRRNYYKLEQLWGKGRLVLSLQ